MTSADVRFQLQSQATTRTASDGSRLSRDVRTRSAGSPTRGAVVWRAGDGSKPSAEHLVPKQAAALLDAILHDAPREVRESGGGGLTLAQAYEGRLASNQRDEGLKRTTTSDYDWMAERVFRELGADSPVSAIGAATVIEPFDDLRAERVVGAARAERASCRQGRQADHDDCPLRLAVRHPPSGSGHQTRGGARR